MAVVGESGSGKTTLLQLLSAQLEPSAGKILYRMRDGAVADLWSLGEAERRFLLRTDWGYVHQDPQLGLRMGVSAGGNVGERLMAVGAAQLWRHSRRPPPTGSAGSKSRRTASTICPAPIPAACGNGCRSRAIW